MEIQHSVFASYKQDFSKRAPHEIVPRIRMRWNSIPAQLTKENKKFSNGLVKEGLRAKDCEMDMRWHTDCGLVHKVSRITVTQSAVKSL